MTLHLNTRRLAILCYALTLHSNNQIGAFQISKPATRSRIRQSQQQQHHQQRQHVPYNQRFRDETMNNPLYVASSTDSISASSSSNGMMNATDTIDVISSSSSSTDDNLVVLAASTTTTAADVSVVNRVLNDNPIVRKIAEKVGTVDDDRLIFPELYSNNEDGTGVSRMYSSLKYEKCDETGSIISASHTGGGSIIGTAALIAGTTIGAGILALPTATAPAGFLPSTFALTTAYIYMTMSGLLIAELTLNRFGTSGKPGVGILELFQNSLGGGTWSWIASSAYLFLHYAVMVAYVAQGGTNTMDGLAALGVVNEGGLPNGVGQLAFASAVGLSVYSIRPSVIEKVNNVLVGSVIAAFLGIIAIGAPTTDFGALLDPINQHPEETLNCLPIIFLSLVYQNVVPYVVTELEGDRSKITKSLITGTTIPYIMFLAWNAVILGNVAGMGIDISSSSSGEEQLINPIAILQSSDIGILGPLVSVFSSLAIVTSMIGFTYGLADAWTDILKISPNSKQYEQRKVAIYGLVFIPPIALSVINPDIFFNALDYGGAFGVSTLFLVLPPLMTWNERYGDTKTPLITKPMVPLGKIPLGSMWKAAGTLIIEQGAEKLGVFDYIQEHFLS